ncbi:lipid-binding SYLF domain-containing protein [Desulfobulbus rhabdoformis]|uniref:lipid-binding SYLF domain-containing protein n=1 Tax=Desulfobulbus rhabdoformis TaxID=34032 RepID=UPI001965AA50|nr:lipid-binding SYLF domain-containing protein [Desulfobulbus rhabdoformis]MBM9614185.1 lipid-binding SYLF domain-containing protein [Desulfobulbus rhabdoformis]
MPSSVRFALFPLLLCLVLCSALPARAEYYTNPESLVNQATVVYRGFLADPDMQWFRNNVSTARGIFIVPQLLRGGFIVGGSGGRGVLLAQDPTTGRWSSPAFYSMGSLSVGFQIGADASEIILLVMTDRGLKAMLSTDFKLGADVAVAAGPVGISAKAQTADILAFGRSQGLYGGISLEGAIINPLDDWNRQYYTSPVQIFDILITQKYNNPQADALRQLLPKAKPPQTQGKPLGW